jgi:uncharacterized membrane protein YidH (DUF202 family)
VEDAMMRMSQNIGQALTRGGNLDALHGQAHELADDAAVYHREATGIRRRMCRQNYRTVIIVVAVIIVVIALIALVFTIAVGGGDGGED